MYSARSSSDLAILLESVARYAAGYLKRNAQSPNAIRVTDGQLREKLGGALAAAGRDAGEVVAELIQAGEPGISPSTSGGFFGFVTGGAFPVAVATEWLTSVWDQTPVLHVSSPTASIVEETVVGWLIELFGLPAATSVGVTSGCASANLIGLAAARHHALATHGWDVQRQGLFGAPAPRVLVSRTAHVTVLRALRLLGLGGQLHPVDTDGQGRMRVDALADALAGTSGPLIVCGQVGNVDTGAVDPLAELCALTHAAGGWVHLDAAFGMWAAASPRLRSQVAGIELADSWATDAHKWLNVPYDCGLALCAHPDAHRAALRAQADYLPAATDGRRDPVDYTPEMSRRARALVLWTTLRHLGTDGVAELVERCCALARRMAGRLSSADGVVVVNDVALNQVLVRFVAPPGGDDDAHTATVVERLQRSGVAWASPTVWRGWATLRLSVCNWQTDEAAVDACADALVAFHRRPADRDAGHEVVAHRPRHDIDTAGNGSGARGGAPAGAPGGAPDAGHGGGRSGGGGGGREAVQVVEQRIELGGHQRPAHNGLVPGGSV